MTKLSWLIEFQVDQKWVEDGFELTAERANDMLANALPFAYGHEFSARVVNAPLPKIVAKIQGYKSVAEMRKMNSK